MCAGSQKVDTARWTGRSGSGNTRATTGPAANISEQTILIKGDSVVPIYANCVLHMSGRQLRSNTLAMFAKNCSQSRNTTSAVGNTENLAWQS